MSSYGQVAVLCRTLLENANQTETMLVRIAGTDHRNATGACNEPPILAARAAIQALTNTHFDGHSLNSPPF